ncbi:EAL domain-containing protein [Ureibacillus sp. NPDC094379]
MKKQFKRTSKEKNRLENDEYLESEFFEHLNDAVVKLDIDGNIVSYNQEFTKRYGDDETDFNKPFLDIFFVDHILETRKYFKNAISGNTMKFEAMGRFKNEKSITIDVTFTPLRKKDINGIYVILKNKIDFEKQEREKILSNKMREAFNGIDYVCNYYYDAINDYHYFSKQFNDIFKISEDIHFTPSLKHVLRYVHPDDHERVKNTVERALNERVGFQITYQIVLQDQTIRLVKEKAEILLDHKGHLDGLVGFIQDITDQKTSNDLVDKENHIKILYNNPDVGIWSMDLKKGECINSSKGIKHITGYTKEDFNNGLQWTSIVHKEDLKKYLDNQVKLELGNIIQHQYRILNKNGDIRWIQDYTIPTINEVGRLVRLDGLTSDITEQKVLQEKIEFMANYDFLTKLPNRYKFIEKIEQLTEKYSHSNFQFAIITLDIDSFKYVNDTVGSVVGDELLKQFTNRITDLLSPKDMLARRGGDEFIMLLDKIGPIRELEAQVTKIIECLNEPFKIKDFQLYITASIGISTYPENGLTSLELLRNANLALQNAKKDGKNNYHILSHSNSIQSFKNYSIGRDLKKALERKEMVLYFQPRVDSRTNQIIGAEALIRWNHTEWGLISPREFLTIAEENGLITEIDDWVLNEACNQIKNWKNRGIRVVPISINISAIHFLKPDWPNKVAEVIRDAGIQRDEIEFEITESIILNKLEMVKSSILRLKELGIKIIMDDFGKGYSSLSYLTEYPFDVIKIDKSFIRNMHHSDRDLHLTKSIIYMARGLNIRVVAEGVETLQQLKILQEQECYEIQGYLFSHPVQVNEFEELLKKKTLLPMDPEQKAKQSKRKHYRLNFPYPLEANIKLVSIASRSMELGVSKVLVEDISVGGLRFVSNLKLPIRGDVIYQFETELLGESVTLNGNIVWKEEMNEDLVEYGIKFVIDEDELASFSTLLNSFIIILKNSSNLPPYRKASINRYQYFK